VLKKYFFFFFINVKMVMLLSIFVETIVQFIFQNSLIKKAIYFK